MERENLISLIYTYLKIHLKITMALWFISMQEALLLVIKLETKKCYLGYVVKAMLLQA